MHLGKIAEGIYYIGFNSTVGNMNLFWKIFSVISIVFIGGALTCGGNWLFFSTFNSIGTLIFGGGLGAFYFWGLEVFLILIYGIWKVFYSKNSSTIKNNEGGKINYSNLITSIIGILIFLWIILTNANNWIYWVLFLIFLVGVFKEHILHLIFREKKEPKEDTLILVKNKENYELMNSLSQVDISNITSVSFEPKNGEIFIIKTPNMKRLAVYITSKLGKTIFEPEELRNAFNFVVKNISSDLSKKDFDLVGGKINEFVTTGGEVRIHKI